MLQLNSLWCVHPLVLHLLLLGQLLLMGRIAVLEQLQGDTVTQLYVHRAVSEHTHGHLDMTNRSTSTFFSPYPGPSADAWGETLGATAVGLAAAAVATSSAASTHGSIT